MQFKTASDGLTNQIPKRLVTGKVALSLIRLTKELLLPIKDYVLTFTFYNGKEFTTHEQIAECLECDTYFAKPYHN